MGRYTFGTITRWFTVLLIALGLVVPHAVGAAGAKANARKDNIVISGDAQGDRFGDAIAMSGDGGTIVVGADAVDGNTGTVYLLTKQGDGGYGSKVVLGMGRSGNPDAFGSSVAVTRDGGTIVVGADATDGQGLAYVYTRGASGGYDAVTLHPTDDGGGLFGVSVAVSDDGDTVVVGAPYGNGSVGAAYVFMRQPGGFAGTALGAGTAQNDYFGDSVAISGNGKSIVVGADGVNTGTGAVYLFTGQGGHFQAQATLGTGSAQNVNFGESLAISADGSNIIVGAPFDNDARGNAYLFTKGPNGGYAMQLLAQGTDDAGNLGSSVAISPDAGTILVGGTGTHGDTGGAYLFTRGASGYAGLDLGAGVNGDDRFGSSVAVSADGGVIAVGATNVNNNTGTVTIYRAGV